MVTYLVGAVIGSISMHYIAMKYFEKPKPKPLHTLEFELTVVKIIKNILVREQEFGLAGKLRDYQKSLENKEV